jgi:hypothetical protein
MTFIWVTKKKIDYHLSFYPSGGVFLGAFPVGSDSRYKYTASSRRLEIHSKIISMMDQGTYSVNLRNISPIQTGQMFDPQPYRQKE